ncbi:MAG: efflux RND transporter periplasmic adaptor subunit, partial [Nitrospinae bacterium]|nr:efflux RND transporter periplasmic adaptor subunit [Nitrospinota bacterium]
IMLGFVLLLIGALAFGFFMHIKQIIANSPKPAPETVTTAVVSTQEWQPRLKSVGTMTAVHGVEISSEVPGQVRSVNFKSGQDVKAGDLLAQLNDDSDIAQLTSLQAAADLAAVTLKRDQAQFTAHGVSMAQVDGDTADLKSKKALVAVQEAFVAKKTIRAPFAGRLGITVVNPGQYLNPGDKIVTLQAIDPVYVDFYLPQRQVGDLSVGQAVLVQIDSYEAEVFQGKITAISPKVDPTTRNLQVEATVANPSHRMLPGMFTNVMVDVGEKKHYLTLPQTAITYNPYGSTVFVVTPVGAKGGAAPKPGADLEVQQAFVTTGETRGDQVAITSGLREGQTVVTSGQIKLKNGTRVVVDNSVQPANNPNPTPQEH